MIFARATTLLFKIDYLENFQKKNWLNNRRKCCLFWMELNLTTKLQLSSMQNKSANGYWNIAAQVAKDVDAFRHKIYLNYWQDASSRGRSLNHGHCLRTFWIVYSALWRTGMCTICLYSHSELRFYTPCLFERNEIFCSLHSDISMFVRCWKKTAAFFS